MSPAMLPSNFSGCGMNGIALLFAIMLIPLFDATVRASGIGAMKAEALATSAANEATVAFIFTCKERCTNQVLYGGEGEKTIAAIELGMGRAREPEG